jgi:serine/threonine protein kinase
VGPAGALFSNSLTDKKRIRSEIKHQPVRPPPSLSPPAQAFISHCMQRDPNLRLGTADEEEVRAMVCELINIPAVVW